MEIIYRDPDASFLANRYMRNFYKNVKPTVDKSFLSYCHVLARQILHDFSAVELDCADALFSTLLGWISEVRRQLYIEGIDRIGEAILRFAYSSDKDEDYQLLKWTTGTLHNFPNF